MPSDRGFVIIQTWEGFGSFVLGIVTVVIMLVGLGASSASGPSITQAPIAVEMMQRLAVAAANAADEMAVTRAMMQRLAVAVANAADDMAVTHEQMRRLGA